VFVVGEQSHLLCMNTAQARKESTAHVTNLGYYFCDQHILFSQK